MDDLPQLELLPLLLNLLALLSMDPPLSQEMCERLIEGSRNAEESVESLVAFNRLLESQVLSEESFFEARAHVKMSLAADGWVEEKLAPNNVSRPPKQITGPLIKITPREVIQVVKSGNHERREKLRVGLLGDLSSSHGRRS